MKPCVYILLLENGQYYVGSTTNLQRRIKEHQGKYKAGTKYQDIIKVAFYQEFDSYSEARKIENRLKRYKNKKIIEKIISDGKIKHTGC